MSVIIDFYREVSPDYLGRWLRDIWAWDNDRLEMVHNYIQWLFPNEEPSFFNPGAPRLDRETVATFRTDEGLRRNLAISQDVMLRFYGLEYNAATGKVIRRPDFEERARNWIDPFNHNYLRITRILHCLLALGLGERARAFFDALLDIYAERGREIGSETFNYWRSAARAPTVPEPAPLQEGCYRLRVLSGRFAICRLLPDAPVPAWDVEGELVSITRTRTELSVVCPESAVPPGAIHRAGWRCLEVAGPLNLSLVGVLASLLSPLSNAGIGIFVVATFDTDHILIKEEKLDRAIEALEQAGHRVSR
jgi:hypothetical protein